MIKLIKLLLREPITYFMIFVVVVLGPMIYVDIKNTNNQRHQCEQSSGRYIKTDNVSYTCFNKDSIILNN